MASLTFTGYTVRDDGIALDFEHPDPGPARPSVYTIVVTDAELAAVTTAQALRTLAQTKLQRKVLAANIASKLDDFIGQTVTI